MIRNGLYLAETTFLDGVEAYNRHVMVLRDGTMRGGGGFYYTVGSYTCSDGKWKGEMTSREHSPISGTYPWARKTITIGFTGTYSRCRVRSHGTGWQAILSVQIRLPFAIRGLKELVAAWMPSTWWPVLRDNQHQCRNGRLPFGDGRLSILAMPTR